ncbi:MAG: tetratricopeptide repeat protein, partial [Candidatus Omnitrophica bacterium]|nr:tetratricopeptide repeat protein [Candidatus Omnitrophota bacterium]
MLKKNNLWVALFFLLFLKAPVFSADFSAEYLSQIGIEYFRAGRYTDALDEFQKALMVDPGNKAAKDYIGFIFQKEVGSAKAVAGAAALKSPARQIPPESEQEIKPSREEIISQTFADLNKEPSGERLKTRPINIAGMSVTGDMQLGIG